MNKFIVLIYDENGSLFGNYGFYDRPEADEFAINHVDKNKGRRAFIYRREVEYS